jgi:hypothetical protein
MKLQDYLTALSGGLRRLARRLSYAAGVLVLALTILTVLVIEREPWVWQKTASSQHYLAATRNILHATAKTPGELRDKDRVIALTEEDLTAVANYALERKKLEGAAQANIYDKRLVILVTVKIPVRFAKYYLNLKLIADDAEPRAFVKQVKAGFIALPKPLVRMLFWWLTQTTHLGRYVQLTLPLLQEVRIGDGRLRVALNWDPEVMGQVQDLVAELADKERLRVYYTKLAEWVGQSQSRRFIGLSALLRPLFALAKERSGVEGGDAREENRALILVLAAYANGKNLAPVIYPGMESPNLPRRDVLLSRRIDAAQHFTASAVLVISGQRAFADMVGLAKEFNDTHGGSGFSFTDLAADRAGASFGKMAVNSEASARRVQEILSQNADEPTFMPTIKDLPENLSAEDLALRFGDIDSPGFQELKKVIEDRIAACPLYH